jgi:peptidoglycan/xylan/chitin deacetylase (PgdA/CDA1 family)
MRRWLRFIFASVLFHCGIFRLLLRRKARQSELCILGLHRVLPKSMVETVSSPPPMIVTHDVFKALVLYLREQFRMLPPLPAEVTTNAIPSASLTFDDGWWDNLEFAAPVLAGTQTPASIFVVTGLIGSDQTFWIERLYAEWKDPGFRRRVQERTGMRGAPIAAIVERLKRVESAQRTELLSEVIDQDSPCPALDRMLTWDELQKLQAAGVAVGSHTVTHPLLTYENAKQVKEELVDSKVALQQKLQGSLNQFAYPNGDQDRNVREIVRACGYDHALTTEPRWARRSDDPLALPRFLLHDGCLTSPWGEFSPAMFLFTVIR